MDHMQVVDWIFLGLLVLSTLIGLFRGFIKELVSLAGLVAAFALSSTYAQEASGWFSLLDAPSARYALAFALIFLGVLLVSALIGWLLNKIIEVTALKVVIHLMGLVFGLVRGGVWLLVIAVVIEHSPLGRMEGWQASAARSVLGPLL